MPRHGDILACGCKVGRAQRCEEGRRLEDARDRARIAWLRSSRDTNAEMAARYDEARAALQAHFDAQEVVRHVPLIPLRRTHAWLSRPDYGELYLRPGHTNPDTGEMVEPLRRD